jgi:hypothetical protein
MQQPIPIPEEPHDATFFDDKVAICTPKAIYMMEPMKYVCRLLIGDRELTVLKVRPIRAIKWCLNCRIPSTTQMLFSGYLNGRRRS